MDPVDRWLAALEVRHMRDLRFQDVRRAVQALSSLYVERRDRLGRGSALDGAGKRAAFAMYFSPLRFLLSREIVRSLGAPAIAPRPILDLGCGAGPAGAAWGLEIAEAGMKDVKVTGIDLHPWAAQEARWTYQFFGLRGTTRVGTIENTPVPADSGVVVAFTINELSSDCRDRMRSVLVDAARQGCAVLVIEPIARRLTPWWDEWADRWRQAGGREDSWRFRLALPDPLARMDKAAGLDHRELTGRSLFLPPG
jgi:SAM-dependent methyltransferase